MATPGQYLVNNTVTDCNSLLAQLRSLKQVMTNIVERMEAIGASALSGYQWPEGYVNQDFLDLYNALKALPGSVVEDDVRDSIYKLVSHIQ